MNERKKLAERVGFEPTIPESIHALQACALNRSATSPIKEFKLNLI